MRDELVAGIKNALSRGASLESAITSFINAGYNAREVEDAANFITNGAITIISSPQEGIRVVSNIPEQPSQINNQTSSPQFQARAQQNQTTFPQSQMPKDWDIMHSVQNKNISNYKNRSRMVIISLIVLLLILIIALITTLFFWEDIFNAVNNLIS